MAEGLRWLTQKIDKPEIKWDEWEDGRDISLASTRFPTGKWLSPHENFPLLYGSTVISRVLEIFRSCRRWYASPLLASHGLVTFAARIFTVRGDGKGIYDKQSHGVRHVLKHVPGDIDETTTKADLGSRFIQNILG